MNSNRGYLLGGAIALAITFGIILSCGADSTQYDDKSSTSVVEVVDGSFDFRVCHENEVGVWVEYPLRWQCVADDAHELHDQHEEQQ